MTEYIVTFRFRSKATAFVYAESKADAIRKIREKNDDVDYLGYETEKIYYSTCEVEEVDDD